MAPKFGTSGLRGLVTELTPDLVQNYVRAFLGACPPGGGLFVGRDLRPSSPGIAQAAIRSARDAGVSVSDCGALPTPALAMAAMEAGAAAVMVTGSHIPADRNGLKFYRPSGEISKDDETSILGALSAPVPQSTLKGDLRVPPEAAEAYLARYTDAFGSGALAGLRIGVYQHSSVARDLLMRLVVALGAEAVPLARSENFIPVDTEAVAQATLTDLTAWVTKHSLDAVFSTDGDADRPMLVDAAGEVIAGDILGVLTAQALGAEVICTPVSSNSMVREIPTFRTVQLTKIGSPYVIAAMEMALAAEPTAKVIGFEANGGFLLGFEAKGPVGPLAPLMTRDAFLPLVAPLAAAHAEGRSLEEALTSLPRRVTAADRLVDTPQDRSAAFLVRLNDDREVRESFFASLGQECAIDRTDGLRIELQGERIVHLRPSGNAPEFRVYVEAANKSEALELLGNAMNLVSAALTEV